MGDLIPFRKDKRRWTRPEDYGHPPGKPPRGPRRPRRNWLTGWRPWILLVALLSLWVLYDPMLVEPPAVLSGEPERVAGRFTICGQGRSELCVVDGDTLRIGSRSVRLVGIDAPETHPPRCEAEAIAGVSATAALQKLLNQGPVLLTARLDRPTDDYGRELLTVSRALPDGLAVSIADQMIAGGFARRYAGGLRKGWCP
jgi:micrococcal nuclease